MVPMDTHTEYAAMMPQGDLEEMHKLPAEPTTANMLSHTLGASDPDNPMNWPTHRRLYASAVAWAMAFTVTFSLTCYSSAIPLVMTTFSISMTSAILPFSLTLFGIFFAPIYTPHLSERYGRSIIYTTALFFGGLFHLGAALSHSYTSLAVCRFFAGFFSGPCLVLIEGTFADIWAAETTNTYYAFLGAAQYMGAAAGPVVGNFVVHAGTGNWRWAEYAPLLLITLVLLFGIGMPETYGREIQRRRAKAQGLPPPTQPLAESGVTVVQMATVTILNPIKQLLLEPIVVMISFTLALNWAVTFQWFVTVPIVLETVYGFSPQRAGLAFTGAIGGAILAALCTIVIEQFLFRTCRSKAKTPMPIEYRLIPAMYGGFLILGSIFWVGWTAKPSVHFLSPIFGTAVFIWGSLSVLISLVTYLFDAYPSAGTLSALTAAACTRILSAGVVPLVIVFAFTNLTGAWALSIFGFISIPCLATPFVLYKWGPTLRQRSPYSRSMSIHSHVPVKAEWIRLRNSSIEDTHAGGEGMHRPGMGNAQV